MTQSTSYHSVFNHHTSSGECIYLIVYVDNIIIISSDQDGIQKLKQYLFNHFQTKDVSKLKYFMWIEIVKSNSDVVMSQRKYVFDILEEIIMLDYKFVELLWIRISGLYLDGASMRSREISTTSREAKLPHHHPIEHFLSCERS